MAVQAGGKAQGGRQPAPPDGLWRRAVQAARAEQQQDRQEHGRADRRGRSVCLRCSMKGSIQ